MATRTKRTKSNAAPAESLADKMARYGTEIFVEAAVRHFHSAKRKALLRGASGTAARTASAIRRVHRQSSCGRPA